MMAGCPRCRQELVENQVDEFAVPLCVPCRGLFLAHADLTTILARSWRAVTEQAAQELQFHATEALKTEPAFACPGCARPMDKYGYMGLSAIPMDRCDACEAVWLDADELQNMVLALARTNYLSERARRREQEGPLNLGSAALPPVAHGGGVWVFPDNAPANAAVVALRLLRLFRG